MRTLRIFGCAPVARSWVCVGAVGRWRGLGRDHPTPGRRPWLCAPGRPLWPAWRAGCEQPGDRASECEAEPVNERLGGRVGTGQADALLWPELEDDVDRGL